VNVRDGRTDGQTHRQTDDLLWHNTALCVASRGKNASTKRQSQSDTYPHIWKYSLSNTETNIIQRRCDCDGGECRLLQCPILLT